MNGQLRETIIRNCSDKWPSQYQPGITTVRVWQKLGPEHVLHLLEHAAAPARADVNALLRLLARGPWRIGATVHAGGQGDAHGVDENPHVTLSAGGRSYQLRCRQRPDLHVVQITA